MSLHSYVTSHTFFVLFRLHPRETFVWISMSLDDFTPLGVFAHFHANLTAPLGDLHGFLCP